MNFPGRIGAPASIVVKSTRQLAASVAGWNNQSKSWSARPAKQPRPVAGFSPPRAITATGLEILLDVGIASTVWDTGLPLTPAGIWAVLRYALALDVSASGQMCLSQQASTLRYHHRTAMSEYLGIAVAMQVVREILATRHPGAQARFVDAEFALAPGSPFPGFATAPGNSLRPDYFVLVPGGPVYVLECKGSGSTATRRVSLAKAVRQLESVRYQGGSPSGFCTHVELSQNGITCVILDPDGDEGWDSPATRDPERLLSSTVQDETDDETVVLDVAGLRAELEDISRATLLDWSGAVRSADHLIPPRVKDLRNRPSREADAPATSITFEGFEFTGIESTYPYAGRLLHVFRGIDSSLRASLLEIASLDNPALGDLAFPGLYNTTPHRTASGDDDEAVAISGDGGIIRLRLQ